MDGYAVPNIKKTKIDTEKISQFNTEDDFNGLAVKILVEVGSYICVSGNIFSIETKSWSIGQAIVGSHLVRLYKLISAMLDQTCQYRRETTFIFCRLAFECIINLRYLIKNASEELFWSYKAYSLKHEHKLHNTIKGNIAERGGEIFNIEQRMLSSIEKSFQASEISMDEIQPSKIKNWGGKNIYEKAENVGLEKAYLYMFGGASHSIHGNWQDMLEYNLEKQPNGSFNPNFEWSHPRPQLLTAIALLSSDAIIEYLNWVTQGNCKELEKKILDLKYRIILLSNLHENFLSS